MEKVIVTLVIGMLAAAVILLPLWLVAPVFGVLLVVWLVRRQFGKDRPSQDES